jgi:hypothetical protein
MAARVICRARREGETAPYAPDKLVSRDCGVFGVRVWRKFAQIVSGADAATAAGMMAR